MRADVRSEISMLRELVWFLVGTDRLDPCPISCCFCYQPLLIRDPNMTFGHRRHPRINVDITIHHRDENREHNNRENLFLCHTSCHKRYHAQKRAALRKEVIKRHEERQKLLQNPEEV